MFIARGVKGYEFSSSSISVDRAKAGRRQGKGRAKAGQRAEQKAGATDRHSYTAREIDTHIRSFVISPNNDFHKNFAQS